MMQVKQKNLFFQPRPELFKRWLRWPALLIPMAVTTGSVVALFLWLLSAGIHFRFAHPWLLFLLPGAGVLIHVIYRLAGKSAEKGNNLIIDEIHRPGAGVPARMGPVILLTTVITHLFGGSAGREGTAVQLGGSIAGAFSRWFPGNHTETSLLLTAGVAAGFGAVFGTPLTGAVFALEVLTTGRIKYRALLPALLASYAADLTVRAWGVHHTAYTLPPAAELLPYRQQLFSLGLKVACSAVLFGLASLFFVQLSHRLKSTFSQLIKKQWMIPVAGALVIIALTTLLGKPDYLSLGVDAEYPGAVTIPSAFHSGGADTWSWFWKTVYTAVTLSSGFKGGEVTPLFYIGATLGNTLAMWSGSPAGLFAALGFIAVFAGATNTPLACTLMGAELFGPEFLPWFALACFISYLFSGHSGIYTAQQREISKQPGARIQNYIRIKLRKYC